MAFLRLKKIDEDGTGRKKLKTKNQPLPCHLSPSSPEKNRNQHIRKARGWEGEEGNKNIGLGKEPSDTKMELVGMERVGIVTWAIAWNRNVLSGKRLKHILFFKYRFDHVVFQQHVFSFRLCLMCLTGLMCLIIFSVPEGLEA